MKIDQSGKVNPLLISTIAFALAAIGFGVLSFIGAGDLATERDQREQLVLAQVEEARIEIRTEEEARFEEQEKSPFESYQSSRELGSLEVVYPKTWSAYVEERVGSSDNINAYFHPQYVRDVGSDTKVALRLTLENKDYASEVKSFDNDIEKGTVRSEPITLSGTRGIRIDGEIFNDIRGSMVIMPLREKTLKFWTETETFVPDFDSIIVQNITFVP